MEAWACIAVLCASLVHHTRRHSTRSCSASCPRRKGIPCLGDRPIIGCWIMHIHKRFCDSQAMDIWHSVYHEGVEAGVSTSNVIAVAVTQLHRLCTKHTHCQTTVANRQLPNYNAKLQSRNKALIQNMGNGIADICLRAALWYGSASIPILRRARCEASA